jgi:hypothetical protein
VEIHSLLRYPKLFWTGLALYAASFFLVAVSSDHFFGDVNVPGYECAWATLAYPFGTAKALLHPSIDTLEAYFSVLIAGLINPVFLVAAFTRSAVLRIVLLCMVPFCWLVFLQNRLYPREGHLLWIVGMPLVLFSLQSRARQRRVANPSARHR